MEQRARRVTSSRREALMLTTILNCLKKWYELVIKHLIVERSLGQFSLSYCRYWDGRCCESTINLVDGCGQLAVHLQCFTFLNMTLLYFPVPGDKH